MGSTKKKTINQNQGLIAKCFYTLLKAKHFGPSAALVNEKIRMDGNSVGARQTIKVSMNTSTGIPWRYQCPLFGVIYVPTLPWYHCDTHQQCWNTEKISQTEVRNLCLILEHSLCGQPYCYDFIQFPEIYVDDKMNKMPLRLCTSVSVTYFMSLYRVIRVTHFNQRKQIKIIIRI